MSKSILIIDTPETCLGCILCRELHEGIEACCELSDEPKDNTLCRMIEVDYCQEKPKWCSLRDIPEKKNLDEVTGRPLLKAQWIGWNQCIDEILKERD